MAKTQTTNRLAVEVRARTGKGASRRARRDGKIPAVLYGHRADPQHLELPAHDFAAVLRHSGTNAVLTLDIDGKEQLALTKALDIHPIRRNIQHADLLIVRRGEKVVVDVNVIVIGEAAPGTLVTQEVATVQVESDALAIPDDVEVSVARAEAGTRILARDIVLPPGVELRTEPDYLVVNVVAAPTAADMAADTESVGTAEEAQAGAKSADQS